MDDDKGSIEYRKGNGEDEDKKERYFFIKTKLLDKNTKDHEAIIETSKKIHSYLRNKGVLTNIPDNDDVYLLMLQNDISFCNNQSMCFESREPLGLSAIVRGGITRHHIIEANQYLKEMHESARMTRATLANNSVKYSFNYKNSWMSGNLLFGPNPDLNYHDGSKCAGNTANGYWAEQQKETIKMFPLLNNEPYASKEMHSIEIFPLLEEHTTSSLELSIEKHKIVIKNCIEYYAKYRNGNEQIKEYAMREFVENWESLGKLPSITGIWSKIGGKWGCHKVFSSEKDIYNTIIRMPV